MVLPLGMDIWQLTRLPFIQRAITIDVLVFYDSVRIMYNLPIFSRTPQHA